MAAPSQPIIVVEDDPFPRLIQVILDPTTPAARIAAFSHFFAHELPELETKKRLEGDFLWLKMVYKF